MSSISLLAYLAPASLLCAAALAVAQPGLRPTRILLASRTASFVAILIAAASLMFVVSGNTTTLSLFEIYGLGFSMRLDALSVTMFALVAFVGLIVLEFSRNYLDGDERQGVFFGWMCATLAAVMMLVTAGNLLQLIVAWMATSLSLHRLLSFYADRPIARIAARKKFIVARIGDLCLGSAAIVLYLNFGTGDIALIAQSLRAMSAASGSLIAAALLLGTAGLLKSAQFPAHSWLTEVIETPTPVSALLHAGIVNAGGFLIIRFSDLIVLSAPSMYLLAIVGGFTALFGGLVMLTQPSVKVSLAWSTISQMGFMIMQCGFGAFALATAHIVAHSLYKAHAFLASGSAVEWARLTRSQSPRPLMPLQFGVALLIALTIYGGIAVALTGWLEKPAATIALGAILTIGLSLYVMRGMQASSSRRVISKVIGTAVIGTLIYFTASAIAAAWLGNVVAPTPTPGPFDLVLMVLAVVSFLAVVALQIAATTATLPSSWRTHIANGLYVNAIFNRIVFAYRIRTEAAKEQAQ